MVIKNSIKEISLGSTSPPLGFNVPCTPCKPPKVLLYIDDFGMYKNPNVEKPIQIRKFTWVNKNRMSISVINYGATIVRWMVPDRKGVPVDIVMGFDTLDGYVKNNYPGFGTTIGRVCNKIKGGTFTLNGIPYYLSKNLNYTHFIDGGNLGFGKVVWDAKVKDSKVIMTYMSTDQEEGFPGALLTTITFELSSDNKFIIDMQAVTTQPTPVNLTVNNYFNLGGHSAGQKSLLSHWIMINADSYTVNDLDFIPNGEIRSIVNKKIDLQSPKKLGDILPFIPYEGFDQNFCLNRGVSQDLGFAVRVYHPLSGRVLEMYSNQPGLQFYTGKDLPEISPTELSATEENPYNFEVCCKPGEYPCAKMGFDCMNGPCKSKDPKESCCTGGDYPCPKLGFDCNLNSSPCEQHSDMSPCCVPGTYPCPKLGFDCAGPNFCGGTTFPEFLKPKPILGKNKTYYHKNGAFCINSQNYPNAVNHNNFPSCILNPGQTYKHKIVYKFWLLKN